MKRAVILTILLSILPLMGLVKTEAPWFWLVSTVFVSFGILLVNVVFQKRRYRLPFTLLSVVIIHLINSGYFFSYLLQNEGFNAAFVYHLRPDVLFGAVDDYFYLIMAEVFHWFLLILVSILVGRHAHVNEFLLHHRLFVLLITIISISVWSPTLSIYKYVQEYVFENTVGDDDAERILKKIEENPLKASTINTPNIVTIYLEGVERSFMELAEYPDLTPELNKIRTNSVDFSNVTQVNGTGYTIGGIVASQCGVPLVSPFKSTDHNDVAPTDDFMKDAQCLGDIFKQQGYSLSFLGGADHRFAGKGKFYKSHGYESVEGITELKPQLKDQAYVQNWGLYDDSLFDFAWKKFEKLSGKSTPFALTLLTVDTHMPYGTKSKSCYKYAESDNTMLISLHCADQLTSKFIKKIRKSNASENTVIVVISDHLSMHNSASSYLPKNKSKRMMTYFVNFHDKRSSVNDNPGTHFDIAPTLLDLMGFEVQGQFGFGQSLVGSLGFLHENSQSLNIVKNTKLQSYVSSLWKGQKNRIAEEGIKLIHNKEDRENGHSLMIGDLLYNLKSQGVLSTTETLIKLDDDLNVVDYQSFPSFGGRYKLSRGGLTKKALLDSTASYILIGRNKYLAGLVEYENPNSLSVFVGSPSAAVNYHAVIDRQSRNISFETIKKVLSVKRDKNIALARKISITSLNDYLQAPILSAWFLNDVNLSVASCGFSSCKSKFVDNAANQIPLTRGVNIIAINEKFEAKLISAMDYCSNKLVYEKANEGLRGLVNDMSEEAEFLMLIGNDSIHCDSNQQGKMRGVDKWLRGMDLPKFKEIGYRKPYLAVIDLTTFKALELNTIDSERSINLLVKNGLSTVSGN